MLSFFNIIYVPMISIVLFSYPAIGKSSSSPFKGWVDPDSQSEDKTTVSFTTGETYELVMSDEFERTGRSFKDGHDPMWTGVDRSDDDQTSQGRKSLQYYNSSTIRTQHGHLVIETSTEDTKWKGWNPFEKRYETMKRHFKSGMLQSWNKFCFTGGIFEVNVQFPGKSDVGGLWPAVWLLGNLGRATFEASTNLMWPWSYRRCDRKLQKAQEISGCDVTSHYSLHPKEGRGATEIDIIEVMPGPSTKLPIVKNDVRRPYSAMTLQMAPGIPASEKRPPSGTLPEWGFKWYENLTFGANTSINPFFYGTYLAATKASEPIGRQKDQAYQCDALSAMLSLNKSHFQQFHKFRLEWQPGENGYVHWYVDDELRFGVEQAGLDEHQTEIPYEPSYIIFNTAISNSWGFPDPPPGCDEYDCKTEEGRCGFNPGFCESLPAHFKVDYVRVYQNKNRSDSQYLGCNPKQYPTKRWIAAHEFRYKLPNTAKSLKKVVTGGGRCQDDEQCGEGSCSFSRCHCKSGWMGPKCLVPTYQDDFPDWDTENWAIFVSPYVPSFLLFAVGLFLLALVAIIYLVVRRKRSDYIPIEEKNAGWL